MEHYNWNIFFILISLSLSTFQVYAKKSELRLDQDKASMSKVKNRVQINDICYAHTAADMIDSLRFHYLGEKNASLRTSPLALAIQNSSLRKKSDYKNEVPATFFEYGNICSAVNTGFDHGFKDFKKVDAALLKELFNEKMQAKWEWENVNSLNLNDLSLAHKKFNAFFKKQKQSCLDQQLEKRQLSYMKFLNEWTNQQSQKTYKLNWKTLKKPKCKQMHTAGFSEKYLMAKAKKMIRKHFFKQSDLKKVYPIGIDFCERYLNTSLIGRNKWMLDNQGIEKNREKQEKCLRHAATIIGMRHKKRGKGSFEEVLIKNTRPCHLMSTKFECHNNKIWVSLQDLLKSSFSLHYLKF